MNPRQNDDGTVSLTWGDGSVTTYWVPSKGGYVRRVTPERWGTLGDQVCNGLKSMGPTLWSSREGLLGLIQSERRRVTLAAVREEKRAAAAFLAAERRRNWR